MNDATGERYPTAGEYREVVPYERMVFTWGDPEDVAFYRDVLGAVEDPAGPSGLFEVDDVDTFYEANKDRIEFEGEPQDVPPIRCVQFRDPGGNLLRVFSAYEDE